MHDKDKLIELLDNITFESIDWQQYFEDLEPMSHYDSELNDKIKTIISYLKLLDLNNLVSEVEQFTPIEGNAKSATKHIVDFVTPQVKKL